MVLKINGFQFESEEKYLDEGIGGLVLGAVGLQEIKVVSVLGSLLVLSVLVVVVVAAVGAVDVLADNSLVVNRGGLEGGNNVFDGNGRGGVSVGHDVDYAKV